MNEGMRAFILDRVHDRKVTEQERDILDALRDKVILAQDARRIAELIVMLNCGDLQPEDSEPEAIKWLAKRQLERLEILEAMLLRDERTA
ncbi:hypothetical protein AA0522_2338 [Gluconacetobacter liquefaciens NRIC 0522]|uniref:Uncharacterized protein n=2 Tax=Gluconacetobacter liquefaciens TaxID=89584 RepID=A0A370G2N7_GLULI|nr:hypothetical protein C7453_10474 [Gluconacetobacter liquefaciens]GBR09472.1 hypothetical protein AA0522_2338 [Gluconacetobacter liquefaciens NRIC 0522]